MKQTLTVLCLMIGLAGFSPNSKAPRYFIGVAMLDSGNIRFETIRIIKTNWFKDAGEIFERHIKKYHSKCKRVRYDDTKTYSSVREIDFDNVLTK